jgi:peptide methionine sulfoxide reductase msrA/msrB
MSKPFDPKNFQKPAKEELKKTLSPLQYEVTQEEGTERAFSNAYWDNHRDGIYVDAVSGEPLFSSLDKYDSGSGWPSFVKPLEQENILAKKEGHSLFSRVELRSKHANSHLGHLFDDGPKDRGGQRYCMNSASLRFIPKEKLAEEGYGKYLPLFAPQEKKRKTSVATLAGGCFWGVEELLRKEPGILRATVGYTGGHTENPAYEAVKTGTTGHAESIDVEFDPAKTSYEAILKFFFTLHDPTTANQQGNDIGSQYRSAIFYHGEEQKRVAEQVKARVEKSGAWKKPLVTEIVPAGKFYPAENYHQAYLQKHPGGYTCHWVRPLKF